VDPAIHNSNTGVFKGSRVEAAAVDRRFHEKETLEAIRRFIEVFGRPPTAGSWTAAGLTPSEKTIRRRFGSF